MRQWEKKLSEEFKDVCEIDRRECGYVLIWDDGTASYPWSLEDARKLADQKRGELASSLRE
jgi:hypothetical protein